MPLDRVHDVRLGLRRQNAALPPGSVAFPEKARAPEQARVIEGLTIVIRYTRADLTTALVAYLRHRGQWDPAARTLGVHRNTLRHRISRAQELAGLDFDDPDVAALAWLHFRQTGLA